MNYFFSGNEKFRLHFPPLYSINVSIPIPQPSLSSEFLAFSPPCAPGHRKMVPIRPPTAIPLLCGAVSHATARINFLQIRVHTLYPKKQLFSYIK